MTKHRRRSDRRFRVQPPGGTVKVFKMNPDGTKGDLLRTEKDHPTRYSKLEEGWTAPYPKEP